VNYKEWEESVPAMIKGDLVWKMRVYRLGMFVAEIGWTDVTKLSQDQRTLKLSDQLYRALGSIGVNVEEGYSRSSGKDRARFYEYALGSAREARGWYYKGRHVLREEVAFHRMKLLTEIIQLLLTMIPDQLTRKIRDEGPAYTLNEDEEIIT
jgi:four helix bundle protein